MQRPARPGSRAGFAVWCLALGVIEANIIDDIILNNWRNKGPAMKRSDDPFFNPFGLPFPFFGDMSAEEPPLPDMKIADMTIADMKMPDVKMPDVKIPCVKVPDVKASDVKAPDVKNGDNVKAEGHSVAKRSVERVHKTKPWFSVSDFLSFPEMARAHHKADVGLRDRISQTGDLAQTQTPIESGSIKSNAVDDERQRSLIVADDKRIDDRDWTIRNDTKTNKSFKGPLGSSFPKGLSDILIIFQKVGPKTKSHSIIPSGAHTCDGFNCYDGICDFKKPEAQEEHPEDRTKKHSSILDHFDRLFLLIIPIVLGIGTVFFVLELRRIYRKMKKQAIVTTFQHQEC